MNTSPTQDSTEALNLEKLRLQVSTDMEAMQAKEASLREYEQRIRLLVEHSQQVPAPQATTQQYRFNNGTDQAGIDVAWEKYNRAHALLEAARRGLADDRLLLKEREAQVAHREQEVARHEAWIKVREQELAALPAAPVQAKAARKPTPLAAARQLFSFGKSR